MSGSPKPPFNKNAFKDFSFSKKPPEEAGEGFDPFPVPDADAGRRPVAELTPPPEDEIPQNVLYDLAEKALPKTPEIRKVLDYGSNLDFYSLLTAISLQEQFRGKLPSQKLDRLSAAALLTGTGNIDDIYSLFHRDTTAMTDEFLTMLMQEDREDRLQEISEFSEDTRRIFFCGILADLALSERRIREGLQPGYPEEDLAGLAHLVSMTSKACKVEAHLLESTVRAFNGVSETQGAPLKLVMSPDGSADIVEKKDPPALKIRPPKP